MLKVALLYYFYLNLFGFFLLMFRKDKQLIMEDLVNIILRDSVFITLINLVLLYFILPLTIPFSILNILKK